MNNPDLALLILRLSFGLSMAFHGYNKFFSASGLSGTSGWFESMGMKWPKRQAQLAATTEIIAGLSVASGLLLWPSSVAFIALMLVAIITVHWKVGYFIFLPNGGWEYCAAIMTVATVLAMLGGGEYSLDDYLEIDLSLGIWALPIGIALALCHLAISYRPTKSK
jgi:putative oxidoreductase